MQLTEEQRSTIKSVLKDLNSERFVTLGGYAGTGKTTCVNTIVKALENKKYKFAVCAYTGKATNVLRRKGIEAATIHSTIYRTEKNLETNEVYWTRKPWHEFSHDGFIIDEASMVGEDIHKDLLSFGLPILYVGDHGQLEPVGSKFNLMQNPNYRLEKIHRNAGEIAHFAEHLRKGLPSTSFQGKEKVQIVKESAIQDRHLAQVDQIICAFNKTRININERVRAFKKIQFTHIAMGEKIICLRNKKELGLFNGMQGVVTKISKRQDCFNFTSQDVEFENIMYDTNQWGQEKNAFKFDQKANPFDYAYAITCHKSQGDEFDNVIVFEQNCSEWDHKKWSYTAASRAKEVLIWAATPRFIPTYL
jgi:exodeoxyribonuclease-5